MYERDNTLRFGRWLKLKLLADFTDGAEDEDGLPTLSPGLLGFVSSCYQLGSILGVPIAPWLSQRWGRRWSVMGGSLILCVGAIIQGFSQNGKLS